MTFNIFVAWVGIVAFVLAIPMAVAANMLTPKIQMRWAKSSRVRTENRMLTIGATIASLNGMLGAEFLAHCAKPVLRGLIALSAALMYGVVSLRNSMAPNSARLNDILGLATEVALFICGIYAMWQFALSFGMVRTFIRFKSGDLEKEFEELEKRVSPTVDNSH